MSDKDYRAAVSLLTDGCAPSASWQRHSIRVSEVAEVIARALRARKVAIDVNYCKLAGLLHDIGRKVSHELLHGYKGYLLLGGTGLAKYAKPCVSHWLKGRSQKQIMKESSLSRKLVQEILAKDNFTTLSLEEKIICVADSLAMGEKFVTVRQRYSDARKRYGGGLWIDTNEKLTIKFKREIDKLLGKDLYSLFHCGKLNSGKSR
jgi:putative nucleotidyltransferase with HDIG domain